MPFINASSLEAMDVPLLDHAGRRVVAVIAKATFRVRPDGQVVADDDPVAPRVTDVLYDKEDPRSSARLPSDVCPQKRGTDVVVVGEAVSRSPVTVVDVAIQARDHVAPMRVWGLREFYRSVLDIAVSASAPFERMPIQFERAYGGALEDCSLVESRNPSGVGLARRASDLVGQRAPQIEHPARPHRTSSDRHPPVGCGALLPHWSPRIDHAGTLDEAWRATRMPLMPEDFDVRHNNVAHPSLLLETAIATDDPVSILGMTHELFAFRIPRVPVVMTARYDERIEREHPPIDTVLVEPTLRRFELTFRSAFPIGRGRNALRELRVDDE
jgi:hypothetical protein